jgi:hypothetical protein
LTTLKSQWVKQLDLGEYFPGCRDGLGKFIREEFEFSNYYTQGGAFFYDKKDIVALANELKSRNVDLSTYMELQKGKAQLHQRIETAMLKAKAKGKKKSYKLADGLKDIKISDYDFPDQEVIREDIQKLLQQFKTNNLGRYVDVFDDYAMVKYGSQMRHYMPAKGHTLSRIWCNKYNNAHYALKIIIEHEQKDMHK